jgi:hypothetical protein
MKMRWAGHVTLVGELRNAHRSFDGYFKERNMLGDLTIDVNIIPRIILGT